MPPRTPEMKRSRVAMPLILMVAVMSIWAGCAPAEKSEPPNIVLLISDDDDYEHFGFMGNEQVRTPTLDKLAASGTVFTRAYVAAPLCRPSLASILSGRLPHQHGIYSNYLDKQGIGSDDVTLDPTGSLPMRLRDAGYATYATCKFWEGDPRRMGFTDGTVELTFEGFQKFVRQDQYEAFDFIDRNAGKKLMFIWWAPLVPHKPHNPPAELAERFADTPVTVPPYYKGELQKYIDAQRAFYAMGAWFDKGVADLIEKLSQAGELDNTMFVFFVDNGYTIGKPAKASPMEKGVRTPMFVTWPGRVPAGKRIDGLSYALDLHATMLDYAGIDPGDQITSRSLRPLIDGKTDATHDTLYGAVFAHNAYNGDPSKPRTPERDVWALYTRGERYKLVLYVQEVGPHRQPYLRIVCDKCDVPLRAAGDIELFDLEADPHEMNDLSTRPEHKQRVQELRRATLKWWRDTGGGRLPIE